MLGKAASKEGKNWDELLPYLLFAYREVPKPLWAFPPSNFPPRPAGYLEGNLGVEPQESRKCGLTHPHDSRTPRRVAGAREDQHGAVTDRPEDLV